MLCFYSNLFLRKSIKMSEMTKTFSGVTKGLLSIDGVFRFVTSLFVFSWMLTLDHTIFLGSCCVTVLLCLSLTLSHNISFVERCLIVWSCDRSLLRWRLLGSSRNLVRERKIAWLAEWASGRLGSITSPLFFFLWREVRGGYFALRWEEGTWSYLKGILTRPSW